MKKLIIINGTPGVGKSTVSKLLNQEIENSAWLDGDWCWMMNPFIVNEENKAMVESNIYHHLNNYLKNSSLKIIIFSWVIGHDQLMDKIISNIDIGSVYTYKITLMCDDDILRQRLHIDGRSEERIENSIERQKNYHLMNTVKIDTSKLSVEETVKEIGAIIGI